MEWAALERFPKWAQTFLLLAPSLFLSQCAEKIPKAASLLAAQEEKLATLNQQLTDQESAIGRLTAALEVLEMQKEEKKSETKRRSSPKVPVVRLTPPKEVEARGRVSADTPDWNQDEIIADSSHESMHLYFNGLRCLKDNQYDEAVKAFREFLRIQPDHVYSDRAQYLIADTYFRNKEYGLVILNTNLLETRYPYSVKLPEALFKRALAYRLMSQMEQGRATLKELLQRYSSDPISPVAAAKLAEWDVSSSDREAPPLIEDVEAR